MEHQHGRALTRREAIKRGTTVGAGIMWAVPTVQVVGMSRAFANATSPDLGLVYYAIKIQQDDPVCESIVGKDTGASACLKTEGVNPPPIDGGCSQVTGWVNNDGAPWEITLADDCIFITDECFVYVFSASECVKVLPEKKNDGTNTWVFDRPFLDGKFKDISNIQGVICCDPTNGG